MQTQPTQNRTTGQAARTRLESGFATMRNRAASTVLSMLAPPEPGPDDIVPTGLWKTGSPAQPSGRRVVSPVPAAAASSLRGPEPFDVDARMRSFLERAEKGETLRLTARLLPAHASGQAQPDSGTFHWRLVPNWLAESFGLLSTSGGRELFADLHWIQFCVYGLFRAQDDLVDGDTDDPLLAIEANQLLVEATRCAVRHFDGASPFWSVFGDTIDATSQAILTLDTLQRSADRIPHAELDIYKDLSACLKIASAGVAFATGHEGDWESAISPALDRVAVAGQILDDIYDIKDDLAGGRINYAAWNLCRPVFGSTPEAIEAVVASNLATTDRLESLLGTARQLLTEAAQLLPPSTCSRSHAYLIDYGRGIEALGRSFDHNRREIFLPAANAA